MRKLLVQLDSSRLPSVFDRVVAYDAGADAVMSYGAITEADVRDLIHGCIFTRGPNDLKNTAVFIGGGGMAGGGGGPPPAEQKVFFPLPGGGGVGSERGETTPPPAERERTPLQSPHPLISYYAL